MRVAGAAPAPRHTDGLLVADREPREAVLDAELSPPGLVAHGERWHLVASDHGRDALRTYRADRLGSVALRGPSVPPAPGFEAAQHVRSSLTSAIETLRGLPLGSEIGHNGWLAIAWLVALAALGYAWSKAQFARDPK